MRPRLHGSVRCFLSRFALFAAWSWPHSRSPLAGAATRRSARTTRKTYRPPLGLYAVCSTLPAIEAVQFHDRGVGDRRPAPDEEQVDLWSAARRRHGRGTGPPRWQAVLSRRRRGPAVAGTSCAWSSPTVWSVSYTHLRAHETD